MRLCSVCDKPLSNQLSAPPLPDDAEPLPDDAEYVARSKSKSTWADDGQPTTKPECRHGFSTRYSRETRGEKAGVTPLPWGLGRSPKNESAWPKPRTHNIYIYNNLNEQPLALLVKLCGCLPWALSLNHQASSCGTCDLLNAAVILLYTSPMSNTNLPSGQERKQSVHIYIYMYIYIHIERAI